MAAKAATHDNQQGARRSGSETLPRPLTPLRHCHGRSRRAMPPRSNEPEEVAMTRKTIDGLDGQPCF